MFVEPGKLDVLTSRTTPSPALTATVAASPEAPEPLWGTLFPNSSLTSKTASSPRLSGTRRAETRPERAPA
jgi:hypothetical protein